MKSQPRHHHLCAKKSCIKKPKALLQLQSTQTKNDDTTKPDDDLHSCYDDSMPLLVATTTNQRKTVSFRGKALQRRTISLSEFSPDEFHNSWYTAKELHEMHRQLLLLVTIRRTRQESSSSTTLTRRIEVMGT
jgi:hypothetical protein